MNESVLISERGSVLKLDSIHIQKWIDSTCHLYVLRSMQIKCTFNAHLVPSVLCFSVYGEYKKRVNIHVCPYEEYK